MKHISPSLWSFLKFVFSSLLVIWAALILVLGIRGRVGNPTLENLNTPFWKENGPFELSPERGRFALMYSIVENHSFIFSLPIALFAAPDVSIAQGNFVSMFAPGVSLLIIPGYVIGQQFQLAQVGTFAIISLFALLNFILIVCIARKLDVKLPAAFIAAALFLFGSPAFAYAVSLYQHHISTFFLLSSIYLLLGFKNLKNLTLIWALCGFSLLVDNPNFFIMLPIGIFALLRIVFCKHHHQSTTFHIKPIAFLTFLSLVLPLSLLMYLNQLSYGNPTQLAGTARSGEKEISKFVEAIDLASVVDVENDQEDDKHESQRSAVGFFKTRNMPNGLRIHLLSLDRGMIMYTPIMFMGFIGLLFLRKRHQDFYKIAWSVVGITFLVYSMWGDPYGGWAFGSRYLIPVYAILSLGLAYLLEKYKHNLFWLLIIIVLSTYSLAVNIIGAVTTNRIPPQVEVLILEEFSNTRQRYTYTRNMEMLDTNQANSVVFQSFGKKYLTAWEYTYLMGALIGIPLSLILVALFLSDRHYPFSRGKHP